MATALITTAARAAAPLVIEGAKQGAIALSAVAVVYGGATVAALSGYGIYRGGQKVAGKFRSWRANRAEAAKVEAPKAETTTAEAPQAQAA